MQPFRRPPLPRHRDPKAGCSIMDFPKQPYRCLSHLVIAAVAFLSPDGDVVDGLDQHDEVPLGVAGSGGQLLRGADQVQHRDGRVEANL